jgi:RHS repeat-associated protein
LTNQLALIFTYDRAGNLASATLYSNVPATTLVTSLTYSYNGEMVTSIVHKNGSGTTLQSFSYGYDSAGQLSSEVDNGTTTTYGYNSSGELTGAGTATYAYDEDGVANNSGDTIGYNNELTNDGTWSYTYDNAGNMTGKVDSGAGLTWAYGYDVENHLTSAVETSGATTLVSATYEYDAQGNRVQSSVSLNGGTATVTNFVYIGTTLHATVNSSGTVISRYIAGQQPDQWLARVDNGGSVNWYLTDHLDSIREIVNNAGTEIYGATYDSYGNIVSQVNSSNIDLMGYAGYQWDSNLSLYLSGARWYNPQTQQWMTQDPTGLSAGDEDVRRYVGDDPTTLTDPTGRAPAPEDPDDVVDERKKQIVSEEIFPYVPNADPEEVLNNGLLEANLVKKIDTPALRSSAVSVLSQALAITENAGNAAKIDKLVAALDDDDFFVRKEASEQLAGYVHNWRDYAFIAQKTNLTLEQTKRIADILESADSVRTRQAAVGQAELISDLYSSANSRDKLTIIRTLSELATIDIEPVASTARAFLKKIDISRVRPLVKGAFSPGGGKRGPLASESAGNSH